MTQAEAVAVVPVVSGLEEAIIYNEGEEGGKEGVVGERWRYDRVKRMEFHPIKPSLLALSLSLSLRFHSITM